MTVYLDLRPAALPQLPPLDASRVTKKMRAQAAAFLAATLDQTELFAQTLATDRPGLPPTQLATDDEFAQIILEL